MLAARDEASGAAMSEQQVRDVRAQNELMVVRVVALGHLACILELVEGALLEADRERLETLRALRGRQGREDRRVDAAREEHADRHVGNEMGPDRLAQACAQLLDELGLLVVRAHLPRGHRRRAGKALDSRLSLTLPDEQVAGRELPRVAPNRQRRGNGVEREERLDRVEVDLARRQGLQLGCEGEKLAGTAVVERLDPEPVARGDEAPRTAVPERNREHSS